MYTSNILPTGKFRHSTLNLHIIIPMYIYSCIWKHTYIYRWIPAISCQLATWIFAAETLSFSARKSFSTSRSRPGKSHGPRVKWVTTHVWMSHGTCMNESWHTHDFGAQSVFNFAQSRWNESWVTYEYVMSHGPHIIESWHTYEWVMAHMCMHHDVRMNESWHTYMRVVAHKWMSHGPHIIESWHTYEWFMAHVYESRGTQMNES